MTILNSVRSVTFIKLAHERKQNRRLALSLAGFFELPLDIIQLVFQYLHPIDLLRLLEVNKTLRAWLISVEREYLWKLVYQNYPDIPEGPEGLEIPRYKWTYLLFGPTRCYMLHAVFQLGLSHVKNAPMRNQYTSEFPEGNSELPYVPRCYAKWDYGYATAWPSLHGNNHTSLVFKSQSAAVDQRISQITTAYDNEIQRQEKLNEYLTLQRAKARMIEQHALKCQSWVAKLSFEHRQLDRKWRLNLLRRVKKTLLANGHHLEDIARSTDPIWRPHFLRSFRCSRASKSHTNKVIRLLEGALARIKIRRLVSEQHRLFSTRKTMALMALEQFKESQPPSTWKLYPADNHCLIKWELFHNTIFQNFHSPFDYDKLALQIPEYVPEYLKQWEGELETMLVALLPVSNTLDLTTSAFTVQNKLFIGLHEALSAYSLQIDILDDIYALKPWSYSQRGRAAASSLVVLAGDDPETMLADDFDAKGLRFICLHCPGNCRGRLALDWRESIRHFVASVHSTPRWALLSAELTEYVKIREAFTPNKIWSCNRCSVHFDRHVTHREAVQHVREKHAILRPSTGVDLIQIPESVPTRLWVPVKDGNVYRCSRCPTRSSPNCLSFHGLQSHLKTKHGITSVGQEDWSEVKLYDSQG
ncbi:hypothetical protein C8J56DRAFT_1038484 [Mycena floridula]|nr:hypothetical protein C8J56DRAFT_1038484 [Mycena floridula]